MKNDTHKQDIKQPLTPRQRALAVIERKTPPVLASTFKATEEVDRQMMAHFGVSDVEDIIKPLGVCYLHWPWKHIAPATIRNYREENGVKYDVMGVGRREVKYDGGSYLEYVHHPLAFAETIADVEKYNWPKPENFDYSNIIAECEKYRDVALSITSWTLFEQSWALRGFEQFLIDLATNEKMATAIIRHVEEYNWQVITRIYEIAKDHVQFFGTGDDFGSQESLLMSLDMWKKYFLPGYKRAYDYGRSRGLHTWMHCDGNVKQLIPFLIDAGLEILDPLMPMIDDMSPYKIIPEYGRHLCFHGTIDVQRLLPFCTEQEVRNEVQKQMKTLWSRGGLYMAPSHCIQPGTPLKNILAAYEELNKFAP